MTNPTSNFGWQMPTSTDLVTDLPADFETFGQAVDTSLADLKGGTTGQVLSKASNTDMDFTWVAQDDSNAIQNAIVDAKGDLIAASAADTPARLAVGNNGETLVADNSTATGLKWAAPGGMTLLSTTTLSGASTVVSSISGSYKKLYVLGYGFTNSTATGDLQIKLNNGSGQYMNGYAGATGVAPTLISPVDFIRTNSTQKNPFYTVANQMFTLTIDNYADSSVAQHPFTFNAQLDYSGGIAVYNLTGTYYAFAAISSIGFSNTGGNWAGGTVKIYGVN